MVKLSLLLALAENVLSQNDDEDLTLASGDYEIEASGDPISRSIQAEETTYSPETSEEAVSPLVLYGAIGSAVVVLIGISVLIVVKYCNPKDKGSYQPGQAKAEMA